MGLSLGLAASICLTVSMGKFPVGKELFYSVLPAKRVWAVNALRKNYRRLLLW